MSELLRQKLKQAELLLAKKEAMSQKRQEALAEQGALEPKLDRLLEKTKELQKLVREGGGPHWDTAGPPCCPPAPDPTALVLQIEADVSKRYSGRPVNLMGVSL